MRTCAKSIPSPTQELRRQLEFPGSGQGGGNTRNALLLRAENEGLFFEWKSTLLQLIMSEESQQPLLLIDARTKQLVSHLDDDNFRDILAAAKAVPGVVEDGTLWVHGGAVYECIKGKSGQDP